MSDAVIVGLVTVLGTVISQVIISHSKARETDARMAAHEQKQQDTLDEVKVEMNEVKKRLDAHNGYAEKFAEAKKDIAIIAERQKAIQKDVEYLKSDRCKL